MKILIAPGAFKHSLTAQAAAEAIARGLKQSGLSAELVMLPIADGGNGTLDAFLAVGGKRVSVDVLDPLQRPIQADYGLLPDGETAVIEMALASGIELLATEELNPFVATTYGTGQLMQHALENGARRFIIGMGGSATVEGGSGCIQALGVRLLNSDGQDVPQGGAGLAQITRIDTSALDPRWQGVDIIIASDVDNPTLGEKGAAAVFGPQKGASPEDVQALEANLNHFFTQVAEAVGRDVRAMSGGGAAGALSAGIIAFLGGRIESGIDLLMRFNHFADQLAGADLVITGEGQMDDQTIYGKGPIGVARLAMQQGVPTVALVGGLNVHDSILHDAGLQAVFPVVDRPMSLAYALENAAVLVERAALRLGYMLELQRTATSA